MPTAILPEQRAFLPGFDPDQLDPVLSALAGWRRLKPDQLHDLEAGRVPAAPAQRGRNEPVTAPLALQLLTAHLAKHDGHYPDAVKDTKAKRQRDCAQVLARLERLAQLYPGGLRFYRVALPMLDGHDLYDPATVAAAQRLIKGWLRARGLRGEWKLERGRCGGTHAHIVTSADAGPGGVDVYDLHGLACYLVKPADARACIVKQAEKALYTAQELEQQKAQAAEDWLRASAALAAGKYGERKKLPRMFGSCS